MKATIKNNTPAPQGVWASGELVWIQPAAQRTLELTDLEMPGVQAVTGLALDLHDEEPAAAKVDAARGGSRGSKAPD